ncbi:MAG: histidine phosphatase family protein [Alphaproteobacteria bacterium]|nr:MAG: histidine phosphatase family protein [Alphaproteobacteria bacterium]
MKLTAPLYLLRHGETAWNLDRRMQGSRDSDLTARGRAQAAAMGRALASELARAPGPTVFLRSPLGRTCETALIVGHELGLDPAGWRDDPRLAELRYGDWEGSTWAEIEVDHPDAMARWRADPEGFCPPGGESHFDLRRRSAAVLAEIIASGTRTVVVSHGVSGAVLRGLHLGLDARAMFVLDKPQDAFFRLLDGREERILAALEPA